MHTYGEKQSATTDKKRVDLFNKPSKTSTIAPNKMGIPFSMKTPSKKLYGFSLNDTKPDFLNNDIIQRRVIPEGAGAKNITDFMAKNPEKRDYTMGNGHFHAEYLTRNKQLCIDLPVLFNRGVPQEAREQFIDNTNQTWSNKYKINTTAQSSDPNNLDLWKNCLNPVNVLVDVRNDASKTGKWFRRTPGAKFDITYNRKNEDDVGPKGWLSGKGAVSLSQQGYYDTLYARGVRDMDIPFGLKDGRDRTTPYEADRYTKRHRDATDDRHLGSEHGYNVYGHEAGHMLGLDDEYVKFGRVVGDRTDHYNLTEEAFGTAYADTHARHRRSEDQEHFQRDNIMNRGTQVKRHHYVTFWDAMVMAIRSEFPDETKAPNKKEDWQIDDV